MMKILYLFLALGLLWMGFGKREHDKPAATIILVGLPKSGTTAMHDGLLEKGVLSAHQRLEEHVHLLCPPVPIDAVKVGGNGTKTVVWHNIPEPLPHCFVGAIIQRALSNHLPPLYYLQEKGYRAFTQLDVCYPPQICMYPQFEAIQQITAAYPDAYYVHTRRITVDAHAGSWAAWNPGKWFGHKAEDSFLDRMKENGFLNAFPSQSKNQSDLENLKHFIRETTKETVAFFEKRPHLRFLDVIIEDPKAAEKVGTFLNMRNFTLPRTNTGRYDEPGLTASPTPANISLIEWDDDDGNTGSGGPVSSPSWQIADDDKDEQDPNSGAGTTWVGKVKSIISGGARIVTGEPSPGGKGWSDWILARVGLSWSSLSIKSMLLGSFLTLILLSFLLCLNAACVSWGFCLGSPSVPRAARARGGKVHYSPLPVRDPESRRVNHDDHVELIRRGGLAEQEEEDEEESEDISLE